MSKYVKCPICQLNYMLIGEQCCKVCSHACDDKSEDYTEQWCLCPICNKNAIRGDMDICKECERLLHSDDY